MSRIECKFNKGQECPGNCNVRMGRPRTSGDYLSNLNLNGNKISDEEWERKHCRINNGELSNTTENLDQYLN